MSWKSLGQNVRELRIHLCQSSLGSQGVRDFIKKSYASIKNENPGFPFLIREADGVKAKMTARYDYGAECGVAIEGMDPSNIEQSLKELIRKGTTMNQKTT